MIVVYLSNQGLIREAPIGKLLYVERSAPSRLYCSELDIDFLTDRDSFFRSGLTDIEGKLKQKTSRQELLALRWKLA